MKKLLQVISLSGIRHDLLLFMREKLTQWPSSGNNGKHCRVVDYSDSASSVTAGDVWHLFQYNDQDQLMRFAIGNSIHYEMAYDAQGHISKINYFQGSLAVPPSFTLVYTGDFVTQLNYLDGGGNVYFSLTLSWNVKGFGELDRVDIPKTSLSGSGYESYVYSAGKGFAEYHEGSTEPAHPYDRIMAQSIPVNIRPAVANPFLNNTTKDQRFLYWFFFNGIGPIGQLSALNWGVGGGGCKFFLIF